MEGREESSGGKASRKRNVFKRFLNTFGVLASLVADGMLFHALGAETEKARAPIVLRRVRGTARAWVDAERRCALASKCDTWVNCCIR